MESVVGNTAAAAVEMNQGVPDVDVEEKAEFESQGVELPPELEVEALGENLEGGNESELVQRQAGGGVEGAEEGEGVGHGTGAGGGGEAPQDCSVVEKAGGGDAIEDGAGVGGFSENGCGGEELADREGEEVEAGLEHAGVGLPELQGRQPGSLEEAREEREAMGGVDADEVGWRRHLTNMN